MKSYASLGLTLLVFGVVSSSFLLPARAFAVAPADYGLTEGIVIRATGDPDIYIVNEHGYKRLFTSPAIFNVYGHIGWASVKEVSEATRNAFGTSGLFRNCESGDQKVYGLEVASEDAGVLHWVNVSGADAVSQDANFFKKVFCINNAEMALYTMGSAYTALSQVPDYSRGGGSTPPPSSGGLQGAAGSLNDVSFISSLNNEEVGEGANNVKVVGYDIEADNGSDIRLTAVRLTFEEQGAGGSSDLDDYIGKVSVWFGSTKVAEADVDEFSESGGEWTKSIALSGDPVIRADQTGQLYVALSSLDVIDSADLAANDWEIEIDDVRFVDAQGAVITDDSTGDMGLARAFTFEEFQTSEDVELEMKEATDNPHEGPVLISETNITENVPLLIASMSAQGSDIAVKEMTFTVTPAGLADASEQAGRYVLEIDGAEAQSMDSAKCDIPTDCDGDDANTAVTYTFDDIDVVLDKDATVRVRLLADINDVEPIEFTSGSSLKVSVDNSDTVADDQNGDALGASELTGSVNGEKQVFGTFGPYPILVSTSATANPEDGAPDIGSFKFVMGMVSSDRDSYIQDECNEGGDGFSFDIDGTGTLLDCTVSSTADEGAGGHGNFEVIGDEHTPEMFTLTIIVEGAGDFVKVSLLKFDFGVYDIANPVLPYNIGLDDFETDPIYLSAN